ncbi:hypothetical protein F6R98_04340 [Candidatus Methylospira mobilis]|uniref:Uncharacterized protein n=1 Tax=Candidatus Methylospira mobilis TaxID=1808979 RepID=A0A5Q0BDS3_9GAMM|nr:hypothetical protein [Candidatus Methylospira mobilis]QFY41950.1 hypothetical protein F6R98_04340 [Candidatus Methylospira mobilis]WNV02940.1 hypothetical protein RP726_10685 [Candidatus Methylospira mobilis]
MYRTKDGTEVTEHDINTAFLAGKAVIIHSNREGDFKRGLMLNGEHFDTRGKCYYALDETWTRVPQTFSEALNTALYNPNPLYTAATTSQKPQEESCVYIGWTPSWA